MKTYSQRMIRACKKTMAALRLLAAHPLLIGEWEWLGCTSECRICKASRDRKGYIGCCVCPLDDGEGYGCVTHPAYNKLKAALRTRDYDDVVSAAKAALRAMRNRIKGY